jgi:hypothetical protein
MNTLRTKLLSVLVVGSAAVGCAPIHLTHHLQPQMPYSSIPVLTNDPVPNTWNLPQLDYPPNAFLTNPQLAREAMRREERLKSKIELEVHDPRIPLQERQSHARWYADSVYISNCGLYGHDCEKVHNYYPWEHINQDD